ncbi:Der1-like family protein [Schizosaccharomyces japonicus yFS275]|uniref:Derlin n=1 Tax=Schizosaccharomyces japonicus (strain yFS275 / FY16936) TaxID=402676 RepID=B6K572_SCHJY|nr:Der1-like family protein [Schizosaccharomyces japonicus yFS275]EEB08676.1 Der1-like family protein [Schizosaccharomyces japonicus yFS275]
MASDSFFTKLNEALRKIPPVTRYTVLCMTGVTILILCEQLSAGLLYFEPKLVYKQIQVWRIFTTFLYAGTGFPFLMTVFAFYQYSSSLENVLFAGKSKAYLIYLVHLCAAICLCASIFSNGFYMCNALLLAITYRWSLVFPDRIVQLLFGIQMQSRYLPYVMLLFSFLSRGPSGLLIDLYGIAAVYASKPLERMYAPQPFRYSNPARPSTSGSTTQSPPSFTQNRFQGRGRKLGN